MDEIMRLRYVLKRLLKLFYEHFTLGLRERGDVCHIQKVRLSSPHCKVGLFHWLGEKIKKAHC